jgi:alanyl-tRNA synthetase
MLAGQFDQELDKVQDVSGIKLLTTTVNGADADGLRQLADRFRDKEKSGVAVLGTVSNGKPLLVAMVTDDLVQRGLHAGNLVRAVAQMVGGGGGGRPNMAQAGGRDPERLPDALAAVPNLVKEALDT